MSDTMVALGMTEEEIAEGEDWTAAVAEIAGTSNEPKITMVPVRPYSNAMALQSALEQWRVHPKDVGSTQVRCCLPRVSRAAPRRVSPASRR